MINKYKKLLDKFKDQNIAVIGDVMLDKYIFGKVERISPEAPVPIVSVERENYVPGGAANVAANVASLGGIAFLFGIVGDDNSKNILLEKANEFKINTDGILTDQTKKTIKKTRVIGLNQQLLRIDHEDTEYIESHFEDIFMKKLRDQADLSAIVVSDYAKGTITKRLMEELNNFSRIKSIPLIIDPKPKHKSFYKDAFLLTPNKKEAERMCNCEILDRKDLENCGKELSQELNCNVVITTGESGMSIFEKQKPIIHLQTTSKEVYDVSGAGDTVVAALGLAFSSGADFEQAARIANYAAGIKVGKVGTQPVFLNELLNGIL